MSEKQYEDAPRAFTRGQRFLIALASWIGYWLIYLIGRSLRWTVVGGEHWHLMEKAGIPTILTFWHNCLFTACWHFRYRDVAAMTSQNFDGEYIARVIARLGNRAVRGSSSRGGLKALREMEYHLAEGRHVVFTVDGPRGPRYEAKIGPVLLAQRTGRPILCFHIAVQRRIILSSWDHFRIPLPFTHAVMHMGPPIYVPPNARRAQVLAAHAEMQRTLDQLREAAEGTWR